MTRSRNPGFRGMISSLPSSSDMNNDVLDCSRIPLRKPITASRARVYMWEDWRSVGDVFCSYCTQEQLPLLGEIG